LEKRFVDFRKNISRKPGMNEFMVTYDFYLRDAIKGIEHIGMLPERRRDPERITADSIINWGRKYFGKNVRDKNIFFVKISTEEKP
jgi:hypothetical protein